ncbi:hypothetical protein LCGC14_2070880 [marine sediment metagenome]|uniref:Peptidase M41 FtsH extracellular domain-containing protein n=1 Tax=marine sediment metagenome TaxID=412755 RepID=A0A0F9F5U7_9ZZZZ
MPEDPVNEPPRRPGPPSIRFGRNILLWIGLGLLAAMGVTWYSQVFHPTKEVKPQNFWVYLDNDEVKSLVVNTYRNRIEGELRGDYRGRKKGDPTRFYLVVDFKADPRFIERLEKVLEGKSTIWGYAPPPSWLVQALPYIVFYGGLMLLLWFLVFRRLGQAGAGGGFLGNFGRSRHRLTTKEHVDVTFDDVAGIDEAKEDVGGLLQALETA